MNIRTLERQARRWEAKRRRHVEVPDPITLFRAAWGEPDDWQARALTSSARQMIFNCSRQSGKSTVTSTIATHTALAYPGALVLLVAPATRQSGELYDKCVHVYDSIGQRVEPDRQTVDTLITPNGSRIVALPGAHGTTRGFSGVTLVVIDEAAFFAKDDIYYSLRPMLAVSRGRLLLLSTPWGQRGFFWKEWTQGGDDWERYEIPASMCPRIPAEYLAKEKRTQGPLYYGEYECKFLDAANSIFSSEFIEAAASADVVPIIRRQRAI